MRRAPAAQGQIAAEWCNIDRWGSSSQSAAWNRLFRETFDELRAAAPGTDRKSEKRARRLLDSLLDGFVSGPDGSRFVGLTSYLLAVAEQRLGRTNDAAWHWQMAQNLAPELRRTPSDFPDVKPFLEAHLIPAERWELLAKRGRGAPIAEALAPGGRSLDPQALKGKVVPPVSKRKVAPRYPEGAREHHLSGPTIIEVFIDKEGFPREPAVYQGCGVTVLDIAAMDAVGQWRFEPASFEGQPIEVWFYARVSFVRE